MDQQTDQSDRTVGDELQTLSTSNDPNQATDGRARKEQFTSKQRLDMYAFCVLELEVHGNTVSIKKRQQAIKRALSRSQMKVEKETPADMEPNESDNNDPGTTTSTTTTTTTTTTKTTTTPTSTAITGTAAPITNQTQATCSTSNTTALTGNPVPSPTKKPIIYLGQSIIKQPGAQIVVLTKDMARQLQEQGALVQRIDGGDMPALTDDEKTLEQLQQEISSNLRCYSDYQRTQVLTSGMLKNVQMRFARYYPHSVVPSRTTIKHVFEKCVAHGTVDNIKNPRKPSKITQGSEIEQLLEQNPQLSLRQLAVRLNVSVGTISRRCKALGLIPESVTIKHQQLAIARRQKQIKQQGDMTPTKVSSPKGRPPKTVPNGCKTRRQNGSGPR